jgi:hypothetical protein
MNGWIKSLLFAVALPLGATLAVDATTEGTAHAQYYYARRPPPPEWYARYRPVYYHGYAHYYYGGHWYYRDGYGRWQYYDQSPGEICHYAYDYYGDRSVVCN